MLKHLKTLAVLGFLLSAESSFSASLSVQMQDQQGKPLADAVVYVEPVNGKAPKGKLSGIVDQVNKEFTPYVSIVQTGTAITFPNKDNIRHHVYSFSAPKVFDIKLYSGVPAAPVVFDKPGLVVLGCNIHDWMLAYLYVVETPWFAKSGANGQAEIADLPAGEYVVYAAHPKLQSDILKQKLSVDPSSKSKLNFKLTLSAAQ